MSLAIYPQKLKYMGLNTFTPQPSTADFHQRGYEIYGQHRYIAGTNSVLISQFSYKRYDADVTAQSDDPYRASDRHNGRRILQPAGAPDLSLRMDRRAMTFAPRHFAGTHQLKAGMNYAYSSYDGQEAFLPVDD